MHSDVSSQVPAARCASAARPAAGGLRLRLWGAAAALPCIGVLILAAALKPDRAGYGTHEQLGITQCSFVARYGLPCPTCGLTTSVSAAVRGNFVLAFRSQPFGIILAAAIAAAALGGMLQILTGKALLARLKPRLWWLAAAVAGALAGWAVVLALGYGRGSLPIH